MRVILASRRAFPRVVVSPFARPGAWREVRMVAGAWLAGAVMAVTLAASTANGQERELHWKRMDVEAHLDRDGILHVKETQVMVFTGDWNGGERSFNVSSPQTLTLERMVRVDSATGRDVPMVEGDLDVVDGFGWSDSRTLRWRSRLPDDPPFLATERTFRLEFRYGNILVQEGDGFRLDHDFAFTDHQGPIEAYTLRLTLDPVWGHPGDFTGEFGPVRLDEYYGFIVNIPLTYRGAGRPAGVVYGADDSTRYALAAAYCAALLVLLALFFRREAAMGRFAAPHSTDGITEEWLQEVVLRHRPEVVGAAWDADTGAAEVTAVLARLEQEGKIRSRVTTRKVWKFTHTSLQMELLVKRTELKDYETSLVDGLFFGGRKVVTADEIRAHYSKSGFDPASRITTSLKGLVDRLTPREKERSPSSRWPALALIGAGVACYVAAAAARPFDVGTAVIGSVAALVSYLLLMLPFARWWRDTVDGALAKSLGFLIPMAAVSGAWLWVVLTGYGRLGVLVLVGMALIALGLIRSALAMAQWRFGPERLEVRRRMAAARRYFQHELAQPQPRLKDEWFPWLIAFGLASHMDKWFKAFGGESRSAMRSASSRSGSSWSSSGGSSAGSSSWSGMGGGGGFSGGGSSGMWVAAASSVAAGVSKPSSSSGGGSSSGGSSSGGGGGGGW